MNEKAQKLMPALRDQLGALTAVVKKIVAADPQLEIKIKEQKGAFVAEYALVTERGSVSAEEGYDPDQGTIPFDGKETPHATETPASPVTAAAVATTTPANGRRSTLALPPAKHPPVKTKRAPRRKGGDE